MPLKRWAPFFEALVPGWDFQIRQHDAGEAMRLLIMDGEDPDEDTASPFGQVARETT